MLQRRHQTCGLSKKYLHEQRWELDDFFRYRYSQLLLIFARLIREGHLNEASLAGLAEEKLTIVRNLSSFGRSE